MAGFDYAFGISAVDLSNNGILDLVAADTNVGLYWFENDGKGNFTKHIIHERSGEWLERHAIADINGDGQPEIVIVDNINASILWFEFNGDPRDINNWSHHYITKGGIPGAYDVDVADFDGNGALDVVASSWCKGNQFTWFENRNGAWIKHIIEDNIAETRMICAADVNRDGKIDILGTARVGNQVVWYQNPGIPSHQPWRKHIIDISPQPIHGHPIDMDGDGDLDLVMALGMMPPEEGSDFIDHKIVWYENDGNPTSGPWKKHIICDNFPHAFEAIAADLDNDGQIEVVASAWHDTGRIVLFKHQGDPRGPWTMQILKDGWVRANQIILADLNGNGLLDIVAAAERGSNEVRWWRNEGPC